jgi:hypothetical protein
MFYDLFGDFEMKWQILVLVFCVCVCFSNLDQSSADIVSFKLTGAAGDGLLEGNITPATGEVGTGGIGATGITFNTDNNLIHIDLQWGSDFGYTDLSQSILKMHLHGPTASSGDDAFGELAPLIFAISNSSTFADSSTGGSVSDNFFIDAPDAQALLDGRMYVNVHFSDDDTGVIRGYLQAVPEPGSLFVLGTLGGMLLLRRRKS